MEWSAPDWTRRPESPPPSPPPQAPSATRLYLTSLGWGVLTGCGTGGLIGAVLGLLAGPLLGLAGLFYGIVVGGGVALIPSLLGALVVTSVLRRRHPAADPNDVKRDLGRLFAGIVGSLDVLVLLYVVLLGADRDYLVGAIVPTAVVNLVVAGFLYPAGLAIARLWRSP